MKPVYLEFCGLNSFSEPAKIDFRPLLQSGVFGIFGDTGSGKSTILDCIHFALYGEIDRAPKAFNDCINYHSEGAYVVFDFELTTDGIRRTYRVRRERKRKTGTAKAFLYEYTFDGAQQALAEGTRDVDEALQKIVGLTFSDFKMCIALPQGDFAALVRSTTAERVKLVARLFDLEKYGERLSKAVNEKYFRAEEEVNLLKARMNENEGGRVELIEEIEGKLAADKRLLEEAKQTLLRAEEEERNAVAEDKEKKEYDELCRRLRVLREQSESMEEKRSLLDRLPRAKSVSETAQALEETEKTKTLTAKKLTETESEYERALQELENAKRRQTEGNYEEKILALSVDYQKLSAAQDDIKAAEKAEKDLNDCIARFSALKNQCPAEDFEGKKQALETELSRLSQDENLLDYLKHNYKDVLLADAYGSIRADLSALGKKYPQTQEDVERLLEKYTLSAGGETRCLDVAEVNLAFKQNEQKRKAVKTRLEELEKRKREYDENETKKNLLIEQGKLLRQNADAAKEKIKLVKDMGSLSDAENRLNALKRNREDARIAVEKAQEKANALYAEKQTQERLLGVYTQTLQTQTRQLEKTLSENAFRSVTEAKNILARFGDGSAAAEECKKFFDEYGACLHKYESMDKAKLDACDGNRLLRAQTAKREAQTRLNELHGRVGAGETERKRLLALREKYREQEKQLAEKEKRKALCDELRQLVRSNRFLEFIASEYLQEICLSASKTLLSLTGGRYFLRYDKEFKVGDNLDGGNLRAVKTLSGGETFLVSLSLALSLSAAICMKSLRPIEFFFLDEGFGTLDEKLVDTVMDVLGKLSKTFAVGLISHVEELKHRIENKILVTGANERHGSLLRTECY